MEKPLVNPVNKVELPKAEQSVEHFSLSEQEKNIQEVFKLCPELKQIACDNLGIENDEDIVIELGRNKENTLGKVQNINVKYKGEIIIDSDNSESNKLYLVTKEDGTSYVGDIFLPTELQGKGFGIKILQKVSDTLDTKITPTYLSTGGFTSDNAKKMWEKVGNEISPNHEAEKLYKKYLETIFPESKEKDIVYHGTASREKIEDFNFSKSNFANAVFFTKDYNFAKSFAFEEGIRDGLVQEQILNIRTTFDFSNESHIEELRPIIKELVQEGYKSENTGITFRNNLESINIGEKEVQNPSVDDFVDHYIWRLKNGSWRIVETDRIIDHISKKYDSILVAEKGIQNIAVFSTEQIHVLGSKSDIEKFKEFTKKY